VRGAPADPTSSLPSQAGTPTGDPNALSQSLRARFGLSASQLVVGKRVAGTSTASIEVLAQ
jgi:hypothetical protein